MSDDNTMTANTGADDLVSVKEAALAVGVSRDAVYKWLKRGLLFAVAGKYGQKVHLADVRALRMRATGATALPGRPCVAADATEGDGDEYLSPAEVTRRTGIPAVRVYYYSRQGHVATRPGKYGRLVRMSDVLALAEQRQTTP